VREILPASSSGRLRHHRPGLAKQHLRDTARQVQEYEVGRFFGKPPQAGRKELAKAWRTDGARRTGPGHLVRDEQQTAIPRISASADWGAVAALSSPNNAAGAMTVSVSSPPSAERTTP